MATDTTPTLRFEKGTLRIDGLGDADTGDLPVERDDRTGGYRAPAYRYVDVLEALDDNGVDYEDTLSGTDDDLELSSDVDLRPYQTDALDDWTEDGGRGTVVLPTGAGKTYVAIEAIAALDERTFVVVPTLDLVDQWKETLDAELHRDGAHDLVGEYTGRRKEPAPVTVSTYDSAYIHAEDLGDGYRFVVFDEVHHLPSEGYRHIAEFFAAPHRMGLTATYERPDDLHERLDDLVGGRVYEAEPDDLSGEYLAEYEVERIEVDLAPEERERYDERISVFTDYLASSGIRLREPDDYRKIVMRSGNDPRAWEAIQARNDARRIAYGSEAKTEALAGILEEHADDRVIVFTRYNDAVYDISERFLIPAITHETPKTEREEVLSRFREGEYPAVVTSQVLDEGVDVPAANVGVILSGTGSSREYRQRLGRILRPTGDEARLYEVVASDTGEIRTSRRRRDGGAEGGEA